MRVLAEDPSQHFLPTPGPLLLYQEPKGTDIRVDSGVQEGDTISAEFDSMIAKVIVHGSSRKEALNRLAGALADFTIHGCTTNIPFLRKLVRHPHVLQGELSTSWIGDHLETLIKESEDIALSEMILSPQFWCEISHSYENPSRSSLTGALFKSLDGTHWSNRTRQILQLQEKRGPNRFFKFVEDRSALAITQITPTSYALSTPKGMRLVDRAQQGSTSLDPSHGKLEAPMSGKVIEIRAKIGSLVGRGDTVFVIESMKMQLEIKAPVAGKVSVITTALGSTVAARELLAEITP